MTSTAKRLAAPGIEVPGADGTPRVVRFDFAALERIEENLGSMGAAVDALMRLLESRANRWATPVMADLRGLLDASLQPRGAEDVFDDVDADPGTLIEAVYQAWMQAWPVPDGTGKAEAPPTKSRSRGRSSTGGRPSASDEPTTSSGQ